MCTSRLFACLGSIILSLFFLTSNLVAATHALNGSGLIETNTSPFSVRQIISALKTAYPDRIVETRLIFNEWSLRIDNTWFDWAGGRLLPQGTTDQALKWEPYPFYNYPTGIPDYRTLGKEEAQRIEQQLDNRLARNINRNPAFYDALWQADSKVSAWENLKPLQVFGKKVSIHNAIFASLTAIQEELYQQRQHDIELNLFLNRISSVETWNWRTIQGTGSRSYHSYGVAMDLVIKSVKDARLYWLWAKTSTPGWYLNALKERLIPPASMIRIFEKYGFVWGGKWRMYDSMHFEYRPEIMLLNRLPLILVH